MYRWYYITGSLVARWTVKNCSLTYLYLSFVFRWHHIESLLNGGVTITVNFWYKVRIPHSWLGCLCLIMFTHHHSPFWPISSGCPHTQEDRIPPASTSEGGHHEKYWEDAGRSTWKPTWGESICFSILYTSQTLSYHQCADSISHAWMSHCQFLEHQIISTSRSPVAWNPWGMLTLPAAQLLWIFMAYLI